jgi:hypothetical protein
MRVSTPLAVVAFITAWVVATASVSAPELSASPTPEPTPAPSPAPSISPTPPPTPASCTLPESFPNSYTSEVCEAGGVVGHGSSCAVRCGDGFATAGGNALYACRDNQLKTPSLICLGMLVASDVPVVAGKAAVVLHFQLTVAPTDKPYLVRARRRPGAR